MGRLREPRILQDIQDSLENTVEYKTLLKEVDQCKNKLAVKFVNFLSSKPWPHESELNSNSLVSNNNFYLQTAQSVYRYAGGGVSTFSSGNRFLQTVLAKGDTVLLSKMRERVKSIIVQAAIDEKISSMAALKLLDKTSYKQYAPFKAMTLFVGDAGCYDLSDAIYFEQVPFKDTVELEQLNLESREDLGKKYIYQTLHPGEFIFSVEPSVEQAHFGSCESAKAYIESKKLVKGI